MFWTKYNGSLSRWKTLVFSRFLALSAKVYPAQFLKLRHLRKLNSSRNKMQKYRRLLEQRKFLTLLEILFTRGINSIAFLKQIKKIRYGLNLILRNRYKAILVTIFTNITFFFYVNLAKTECVKPKFACFALDPND